MRVMPVLESERLSIRPLTLADTDSVFQVLASIGWLNADQPEAEQRAGIREYIHWCTLNHQQLAQLDQPPYGDRAIILKETDTLIGTCGLVPCIDTFAVFATFGGRPDGFATAKMGLLWTIGSSYQKNGYATEIAQVLINYALTELNLEHIIATTEFDNIASQKVMAKAGMRLERNPYGEPPWLQICGIVANNRN